MNDVVRLTPAPGIASRVIEGEALIVLPVQGEAFILNGTGTRVWELLGQGAKIEAIVRAIVDEYDVTAPQALRDIQAICDQLVERKALVCASRDGAS